jgi:hypothetical protein
MYHVGTLAPTGSTGNVSGASYAVHGIYEALVFLFVVEEVGASPTVTYKFQGSPDGENWFDVGYITDSSDTISTATRTRTSVGADIAFVSNPVARRYAYYRVVTSLNTNVTFRAEIYTIES